jgi:hypothetical protein
LPELPRPYGIGKRNLAIVLVVTAAIASVVGFDTGYEIARNMRRPSIVINFLPPEPQK